MKENNLKRSKGITLIALVVTIIVLLILAAVSITMLTGNNSALKMSQTAKAYNTIGAVKDEVSLAYSTAYSEYTRQQYEDGNTTKTKVTEAFSKEMENIQTGKPLAHGATIEYTPANPITNGATSTVTVSVVFNRDTYSVTGTLTENGTDSSFEWGAITTQVLAPTVSYTNERIVTSSAGTGTSVADNSQEEGTDLYIYFEANVDGGTINSISPTVPFKIIANGTYNFTISYTADGQSYTATKSIAVTKYALRAGINVGDYVNYTPKVASTTYSKNNLDESHTGSTNNTSNLTQETLKWRVLKIYDDGKIDLIANPTTAEVYFNGAKGYNNGVYMLHDICEKLYSNTDHNITARSVSLEDFENNMTDAGRTARDNHDNYGDSPQYGKTNYEKWETTYSNRLYPNLYAKENGSGIESTTVKTDGIKDTEKDELDFSIFEFEYKQAPANPGLTAKQTAYQISINSTNYGDASKALNNLNTYWVASRCVCCYKSRAEFGLRIAWSAISCNILFKSYGTPEYAFQCIRPVVTLGSDVEIIKSNTASNSSTPHTINW